MQEVYHDGTEGEIITADTIEELIPHIKKSLENPNVKFVKVFRGEKQFKSEEERKNILDKIAEQD